MRLPGSGKGHSRMFGLLHGCEDQYSKINLNDDFCLRMRFNRVTRTLLFSWSRKKEQFSMFCLHQK